MGQSLCNARKACESLFGLVPSCFRVKAPVSSDLEAAEKGRLETVTMTHASSFVSIFFPFASRFIRLFPVFSTRFTFSHVHFECALCLIGFGETLQP